MAGHGSRLAIPDGGALGQRPTPRGKSGAEPLYEGPLARQALFVLLTSLDAHDSELRSTKDRLTSTSGLTALAVDLDAGPDTNRAARFHSLVIVAVARRRGYRVHLLPV